MKDTELPGPAYIPTLANTLKSAVERFPDTEFLVQGSRRLTFRQADEESAALAKGLLALGIGKGTRVGLLMSNKPDWVVIFLAATRIGALVVTMSTFYQPPEVDWAVEFHDLDTLIIEPRYLKNHYVERVEVALPGLAGQLTPELYLSEHPYLRRIIIWGDHDRSWALTGPHQVLDAAAAKPQIDGSFLARVEESVHPSDPALVICTSGSTARPKSVVHTHGTVVRATFNFLDYFDAKPGNRTLHVMNLFWLGGINFNLMPALHVGGTLCFPENPTSAELFRVVKEEGITRFSAWSTQGAELRQAAAMEGLDVSHISGLAPPVDNVTGKPIPSERIQSWIGMTETFGPHSINRYGTPAPHGKGGNLGRNLPGVERLIVDPETGKPLPSGEVGELWVRGYTLMRDYYKKERHEYLTCDGFFPTGDTGLIDKDGFFYFKGRRNDMIKAAGANVSPAEIEVVLMRHPAVTEAIVLGLPDPQRGEIVVAVVVEASGTSVTAEVLREATKRALSQYKIPSEFVFLSADEIPRTHSHKVKKPELRALVAEKMGRSI